MKRILNNETSKKVGEKVKVCGWVQAVRSHGKLVFADLRDRSGLLQAVLGQEAGVLRPEWVVEFIGAVKSRPKGMQNPELETGKVELAVQDFKVLSESKTPPFEIVGDSRRINEEKRLKYRYLDLRTQRMRNNLVLRHKAIKFIRDFMDEQDFVEIETPLLTKSTPEGARDFIVPSRLHAGDFYALPQSPQQYKQLLMVAGIEKYFQIARCLRDEDSRGDRQAEFTQLDVEMSFASQEDILKLTEELFVGIVEKLFPEKKIQQKPFPRFTYKEAMKKYKTDRPDLRKNKNNPNELAFCWVLDFPMFDKSEGKGKWIAMHHPFTRPQVQSAKELTEKDMEKTIAFQYDVALNGNEVAGGSIRTHEPEILEKVFSLLGHSKKEINEKFGHLLGAFKYGVPPHGGIAWGLDRFLMLLANEKSIREVMAFPKTGDGRSLMMEAPSKVSKEQLKELHIKVIK